MPKTSNYNYNPNIRICQSIQSFVKEDLYIQKHQQPVCPLNKIDISLMNTSTKQLFNMGRYLSAYNTIRILATLHNNTPLIWLKVNFD